MTIGKRSSRRPTPSLVSRRPYVWSPSALMTAYYTGIPTPRCRGSGWPSAPRVIAARLRLCLQRGSHPRHHPASRVPQGQGIVWSLVSRIDTHALRNRPSRAPRGCCRPRVEVQIDDRRVTRHTRSSRTRSSLQTTDARGSCDGIVVTPSHNPPEDGGFTTIRRRRPGRHRSDGLDPGSRHVLLAGVWRSETVPLARARRASTRMITTTGIVRRRSR